MGEASMTKFATKWFGMGSFVFDKIFWLLTVKTSVAYLTFISFLVAVLSQMNCKCVFLRKWFTWNVWKLVLITWHFQILFKTNRSHKSHKCTVFHLKNLFVKNVPFLWIYWVLPVWRFKWIFKAPFVLKLKFDYSW